MSKNKPLVSIGMPTYNAQAYISHALDSLLAQNYKKLEIIISDNASTDRTKEICLKYMKKDPRISFYQNKKNIGLTYNFNKVFNLASGEYFMWAAHDDEWKPEYIESCLNAFKLSKSLILVGTECQIIEPKRGSKLFIDKGFSTMFPNPQKRFMIFKKTISEIKYIGNIIYGLHKRKVLKQVMPLKKIIANDHVLLAELCLKGEFFTIPKKLMIKRRGGASSSHKNNARSQNIKNPLLIQFPHFVRELYLQKIILQAKEFNLNEKIWLSHWSINQYFKMSQRFREYRRKKMILSRIKK